jgi:hypothetical protein
MGTPQALQASPARLPRIDDAWHPRFSGFFEGIWETVNGRSPTLFDCRFSTPIETSAEDSLHDQVIGR